jgi:hypothetical protein
MTQFSDYQLDKMFCEFLDEVYGDIDICGYKYQPSRALREVDPVCYREVYNNWLDFQLTDKMFFEHSDGTIHDEDESEEAV